MLTESLLRQTMQEIEKAREDRIARAAIHSIVHVDPASLHTGMEDKGLKTYVKNPKPTKVRVISSIK